MGRLVGVGLLALLVAAIYFVETHHQIPRFRLYTFGLAFLSFAVGTAVVPGRIRAVFLVLSSLAFGVVIIEGIAVAKESKPGPAWNTTTPGQLRPVPGIGWDNGAAGVYHSRFANPATKQVVFDVDYTIDKDHDRPTKSTDLGRSLVFWGDSLTWGQGVGDADTLPQRFADLLAGKQKTLNLGVDGYGPAQVLYAMQTGFKDKVVGKDPLAFVMVTGIFHAVRTSCREEWMTTAPRYVERNGKLVYVGDCLQGMRLAVHQFLDETASYRMFVKPRLPRETHDDIGVYIDIVAEIARLSKEKYGVDMLVPYVGGPVARPQSQHDRQVNVVPHLGADLTDTGYDDDSVIAAMKARGVHVVDMTLRDEAMNGKVIAIPFNNHPTPFANQRRAEMILKQFKSMGIEIGLQSAGSSPAKKAL